MVNDDGRAEHRVEQTVGMKLVGMDEIFENNLKTIKQKSYQADDQNPWAPHGE
jgi:hypothetical protein